MLDRGKPVIPAVGDKVTVSFDNAALQHVGGPTVTIYYAPAGSSVTTVILAPGRPTSGHGDTTVSARLPGCRRGCTVTQLVVDGWARHAAGQPRYLVLTGIDFAGQQLLDQTTWSVPKGDSLHSTVRQRGGSLYVLMTVWGLDNLKPAEATQRLAAVTTPGFSPDRDAGSDVGYAVDGSQHPVQVVGRADLLPFVGRRGMLMDLPRGLAGGSSTIPTAQSVVVARADTPESVIDRLTQSGAVGGERQFQTSLDHARERADAQGVRLYVLMSVFAGLIAAVGLAASVSGQREQRRREAASLRVTGVRSGQVGAANRTEAGWLAVCAFVVVAVAGWVAARITLAGLALVPQTAYSPPLEGTPDLVGLLAVAATAGLLIWVVTMWFARGIARHSPPSLLRDEVDR
jgi:hypothetical protein